MRETRLARESLNTLFLADQSWREQKQKTSYSSPCHTHRGGASLFTWQARPPLVLSGSKRQEDFIGTLGHQPSPA